MAGIVSAKAFSLIQRDGIVERDHARVFRAVGSGGQPYVVVIGAHPLGEGPRATCSCPAGVAGRRCYHVAAAGLLMARERDAEIKRQAAAMMPSAAEERRQELADERCEGSLDA